MRQEKKWEGTVIGWTIVSLFVVLVTSLGLLSNKVSVQQWYDELEMIRACYGDWVSQILVGYGLPDSSDPDFILNVRKAISNEMNLHAVREGSLLHIIGNNFSLLICRTIYRFGLCLMSCHFFFPMSFLLFGIAYCQREMGKGHFTFTSPFRLRLHQGLSNVFFCLNLGFLLWPWTIRPEIFFVSIGVWLVLFSTVVVSLQKRI